MAGGAVINIILNAVFITWLNTPGAAIATAITTIAWNLVAAYVVWSRLHIVSIAFWRFRIKPTS